MVISSVDVRGTSKLAIGHTEHGRGALLAGLLECGHLLTDQRLSMRKAMSVSVVKDRRTPPAKRPASWGGAAAAGASSA